MIVAHSLGVSFVNEVVRVIVRGGARAAGDVVQFDLAQSDAAVTNNIPGDPASGLCNVVTPTAAGAAGRSILAVVKDQSIPDDGKGYVSIRGDVYAYCVGAVSVGDPLYAQDGETDLTASGAPGDRAVAEALESVAGVDRRLVRVRFDGVYGCGGIETA